MSRPSKRWIALCAVWACALVAPALAQAGGLRWERVAEPTPWQQADETQFSPRVQLAVADGIPYVTSLDTASQLTVWRPNRRGSAWRQLGGPLNHVPTQRVREVSITTSGRSVWVAWVEADNVGTSQAHLARLVGESFREVVGGFSPINGTDNVGGVSVAVYGGRPYVAYSVAHDDIVPIEVVRLSRSGRAFEHVNPGSQPPRPNYSGVPQLVVSGGRLWLVHKIFLADAGDFILAHRFDARHGSWQQIISARGTNYHEPVDFRGALYAPWATDFRTGGAPFTQDVFRITPAALTVAYPDVGFLLAFGPGGVPYTAFGVGTGEYEAPRLVQLAAFRAGAWRPVDSPIDPGDDVGYGMRLLNADGTLWAIWESGKGNVFEPPRSAHVARLVRR
jgi:hypothetical protein